MLDLYLIGASRFVLSYRKLKYGDNLGKSLHFGDMGVLS